MKGDLGEAFEKLKKAMFVKYRGCVIFNGHFVDWNGRSYTDLQSAKDAIDAALDALNESLKRQP